MTAINIVLSRLPGPYSDFVEVETDDGRGINVGEWVVRPDGLCALRIESLPGVDPRDARIAELEAEIVEAAKLCDKASERIDTLEAALAAEKAVSDAQKARADSAEKYRTDAQATLTCAASVIEMLLDWHEPVANDLTYKGALAGVRAVQRAIAEACK